MALPYEIFIGLRYLRAKRRQRTISLNTFVSIAGITLGVAALIGTLGIMTGFKETFRPRFWVPPHTSSCKIGRKMEWPRTARWWDRSRRSRMCRRHAVCTPPSALDVAVGGPRHRAPWNRPDREVRVTELGNNIKAGRLLDLTASDRSTAPKKTAPEITTNPDPNPPATEHPGIVIGKELSLRLGSFVGDTVNVVSPVGPVSAIGMVPKIRIFTVVAIFESGMFEYDSSLAYIELEEAQKFFNMGQTVTGIEVKVDESFHAPRDCARH